MTYSAYKLLKEPELVEKSRAELKVKGLEYQCLIPKEISSTQQS